MLRTLCHLAVRFVMSTEIQFIIFCNDYICQIWSKNFVKLIVFAYGRRDGFEEVDVDCPVVTEFSSIYQIINLFTREHGLAFSIISQTLKYITVCLLLFGDDVLMRKTRFPNLLDLFRLTLVLCSTLKFVGQI
jgi:hypothetical protein